MAWAKARGIGATYVSDVINGRREPGPSFLAALGLRKMVSYSPALPDKEDAANGN